LSPGLLESYPNPFVDQLNIRFTVPLTVGEGFVWDDEHKPHLKAEDLIPYQESSPRVMMKIYSIAGHEVATLFDERCDVGSRSTSWNGQDTMGRPMAAGTYFCKLQIENWSVTQRVALLR
jgi:flagellar hook assembly protein FlgD